MHIAVMVFLSSDLARVGIHIHTRNDLLAMQSFPLFEEDEHDTGRYDGCQHDKPGNETEHPVWGRVRRWSPPALPCPWSWGRG